MLPRLASNSQSSCLRFRVLDYRYVLPCWPFPKVFTVVSFTSRTTTNWNSFCIWPVIKVHSKGLFSSVPHARRHHCLTALWPLSVISESYIMSK
jgi:hypothetical protein